LSAGVSSGALRSPRLWSLPSELPLFLRRRSSASPGEGKRARTVGLQLSLTAPQPPPRYGLGAVGERKGGWGKRMISELWPSPERLICPNMILLAKYGNQGV